MSTNPTAIPASGRAGAAAGREGHHGLGLSIVRAIAAAHDATVTTTPRPGGGLHIIATFGAARALAAAAAGTRKEP